MKQGRASHSGTASTKVEPDSQAINKAYPGQLGAHFGNHSGEGDTPRTQSVNMYEGRGLKAPMAGTTTHKGGSQGRY